MIGFIIAAIILAGAITIINNILEKKKEEKERNKMMEEKMAYTYKFTEDIPDEEYKKQLLNMLNLINMNLVDNEIKSNKQLRLLEEIKSSTGTIATILILYIVIRIVLVVAGVGAGASVINSIF